MTLYRRFAVSHVRDAVHMSNIIYKANSCIITRNSFLAVMNTVVVVAAKTSAHIAIPVASCALRHTVAKFLATAGRSITKPHKHVESRCRTKVTMKPSVRSTIICHAMSDVGGQ